MKKKQLLIGGGVAVILLLLFGVWNLWFSATKVAFINYQVISLGQISKANDNSFIKISELSTDDLNRLAGYDMVFINAMGLRITEEQRAQIQKAADGGLPVLTTAATNPANKIISLDSMISVIYVFDIYKDNIFFNFWHTTLYNRILTYQLPPLIVRILFRHKNYI